MSMETGGASSSAPSTTSSSPQGAGSGASSAPSQNTNPNTQAKPQGGGSQPSNPSQGRGTLGSNPQSPELFEVKVNGKVQKMTRDELIAQAAMSHAAQQRFEEAARMRRENEKFEESLKKSKIQALLAKGFTKEQIREEFESWYAQEYIEPETLTPEQKRSKEMERELERYRQQEKEAQEKSIHDERERLTTQQRDYYASQIIEGMEKHGMIKDKYFAERMAFYMRKALQNGWDAPLDLIVSQVNKEAQGTLGRIASNASIEQLVGIFGEETINKIRKYDLEQLRKKRQLPGSSQNSSGGGGYGSDEKISMSEVQRRLQEMRLGKR
jgi:hypothetical protein